MPHQGRITRSELLYEGSDFAAWRKKMTAVLNVHFADEDEEEDEHEEHAEHEEHDEHDVDDEDEEDEEDVGEGCVCSDYRPFRAAAFLVQKYVYTRLLRRVPEDIRDRPLRLLSYLKGIATPLRLFDLPLVVRSRIFKFAFHNKDHAIFTRMGCGHARKDRMPALLHTSSQLRSEAIPIFYKSTHFSCGIPRDQNLKHDLSQIKSWAATVATDNGRLMRRLTLFREGAVGVQFRFALPFGLKSHRALYMSGAQLKVLTKHVIATEAYRKALGLEGESLLMAVTATARFWEDIRALGD
jgi:hypothetical protein